MRSYFSYLAAIQLSAVDGNFSWSNKYASVSQDQYAITPTYPAFGSDGLLVGVAGIDVVIDRLSEPLKTLVLQDFARRNRGTLQAPASISMKCYYQNSTPSPVCPGSTPPDSSAICPRTDTSSTLPERTCCGACGPGGNESGLKPWVIALIAIAAVLVLATFAVGIYRGRRCLNNPPSDTPNEVDFTVFPLDRKGVQGDRQAAQGDRQAVQGDRQAAHGERQAVQGDREAAKGDWQAVQE